MSERTAQDALRDAERCDEELRRGPTKWQSAPFGDLPFIDSERIHELRIEAAGYRCEAAALAILASPQPCPHPRWRDSGRDYDYHGNNNHIRYQRCDECGMERRV